MSSLTASPVARRVPFGLALAATGIPMFMATLDNLVMTNALPVIHEDLGASVEELQWFINAYTLVFASLILMTVAIGLLICAALALLPYLAAFYLFQVVTFAAYLGVGRAILREKLRRDEDRPMMARAIENRLAMHGIRVRFDPEHDKLHRYSPEEQTLHLSSHLKAGQVAYRMATQLALTEFDDLLKRPLEHYKYLLTSVERAALSMTSSARNRGV